MGWQASRSWVLPLIATVVMLALVGVVAVAFADSPGDLGPAASVPSTESFSYTGYLEWSGAPANGLYDFRFTLYDAEVGGNLIGVTENVDDQPVADGVFTVFLTCGGPTIVFDGYPRWLLVEVREGASSGAYIALPRQPVTPTPYAWTLHPNARVVGELPPSELDGAIVSAQLQGFFPIGAALEGYSYATGSGVRGTSLQGYGVYGYSERTYAVYGMSNATAAGDAKGYGGYFTANNGVGVYGYSSAVSSTLNAYCPGVYGRSAYGVGVYAVSGEGGTHAAAIRAESQNADLIVAYDTSVGAEPRFRVTNAGNVYADGNYYGAGGVYAGSADYAELLPATDGLEPGDVLVIGADGLLTLSSEAAQTTVVGVYSTEPGFVAGAKDGETPGGSVPLAVLGVVPVKASAENGAIAPGDLLVSSDTPGHAMKAPSDPPQGTVIGKALSGLDAGTGTITMLVTLQ